MEAWKIISAVSWATTFTLLASMFRMRKDLLIMQELTAALLRQEVKVILEDDLKEELQKDGGED
jgi:hypothetical protein